MAKSKNHTNHVSIIVCCLKDGEGEGEEGRKREKESKGSLYCEDDCSVQDKEGSHKCGHTQYVVGRMMWLKRVQSGRTIVLLIKRDNGEGLGIWDLHSQPATTVPLTHIHHHPPPLLTYTEPKPKGPPKRYQEAKDQQVPISQGSECH